MRALQFALVICWAALHEHLKLTFPHRCGANLTLREPVPAGFWILQTFFDSDHGMSLVVTRWVLHSAEVM